jgi:hypothetical protein
MTDETANIKDKSDLLERLKNSNQEAENLYQAFTECDRKKQGCGYTGDIMRGIAERLNNRAFDDKYLEDEKKNTLNLLRILINSVSYQK